MQRTDELLAVLRDAGFEFVVVGGVAAIAHGATRCTKDLGVGHQSAEQPTASGSCS